MTDQKNWAFYVQNPDLLESTRIQILNPEAAGYELEKLHIFPGCRVLEVGCGTGIFSRYLGEVSRDVSYTGIDIDPELVACACHTPASDEHGNTYHFSMADAAALPFGDASFDVVVSHTFLTAAFFYEDAFREMKRVCRPGGLIGSVNISDFGKILRRRHPASKELEELMKRFHLACESLHPVASSNAGIDPARIPEYFASEGLQDVSVYPVGSFFSLSNSRAVLPAEEASRFILHMRDGLLERIRTFESLRGFAQYMSHDDCDRLQKEIRSHASKLLSGLSRPGCWDYDAMLYLLVTGRNEEKAGSDRKKDFAETKCKDAGPKDTVARIRKILEGLGIETDVRYTQPGTERLYSCRLCIQGTDIGQNGKGTSAAYALASGYAEFMERLASGYLLPFHAPDEISLPPEKVTEQGGELLRSCFSRIYDLPVFLIRTDDLLEKWSRAKNPDGKYTGYPFRSLEDDREYFLPEFIYRGFAFTNGSCAGNSREEALVQGICEIMERYAALRILEQKLSPPVIPEKLLMQMPSLYKTIRNIQQESGMRIFILDASLGRGLPVAGALLLDPSEKKASIHFGSHPRLEIAIERAVTELMQGRYLKQREGMCSFGGEYEELSGSPGNLFNILKTGCGVISRSLLEGIRGNASWEYSGWDTKSGGNAAFLRELLSGCRSLGWDVYVRDCSFFDFPVYHVFVPQAGMILDFGKLSVVQNLAKLRYRPVLRDFSHANRGDREKALKTMELYRGWSMHDTLDQLTGIRSNTRVLGLPADAQLMKLLHVLQEKEYETAAKILEPYKTVNESFWCLYQLCLCEKPDPFMLTSPESLKQAERLFRNPFQDLPCCKEGDCSECPCVSGCDTRYLRDLSRSLSQRERKERCITD